MRTAINTTNEQTRGAVVEEGVSKNGMGRNINAEHALGTEVEVDVKTLGVARGDLWGVLGVLASWANLDGTGTALSGNDYAVLGGVAAEVLSSVLSENIEPNDGVWAESAVSPVPAGYVGGEWLVSPVLIYVSIRLIKDSELLTLSW